jgi:hypothetical protein
LCEKGDEITRFDGTFWHLQIDADLATAYHFDANPDPHPAITLMRIRIRILPYNLMRIHVDAHPDPEHCLQHHPVFNDSFPNFFFSIKLTKPIQKSHKLQEVNLYGNKTLRI